MHFLNFLGIGAQKCGTTWLYEKLRLHPDIAFPAGKEVHFWDRNYCRGIEWYESLFRNSEDTKCKQGEITPAYAILPPALIHECRIAFPDLRLIYVLRNPIDRAWSSAKMALGRAEMEIGEASDQWFIDHFMSRGSLMRGDYEQCLRNWLSVYPADQLLLCFYEELSSGPDMLLRRCFHHLDVDEGRYDWTTDLASNVFPTPEHPMPESLRSELKRIYLPRIASLEVFLERPLFAWK